MSDLRGFWENINKPFVGLAPMDGVTDAAFRRVVADYGPADLYFTEFISAEGLANEVPALLPDLIFSNNERPIVAQLFGISPMSFYKAAGLLCEFGFDGIDINMGCPARKVIGRGGGANLINNPELAKKIIKKTYQGIKDWNKGKTLKEFGFDSSFTDKIKKQKNKKNDNRKQIPLSVKTRIGYNKNTLRDWIKELLVGGELAAVSIHGRTLKDGYRGRADWEAIGDVSSIFKKRGVLLIGNGDIKSRREAIVAAHKYNADGVLIGRAAVGNPWVFANMQPKENLKIKTAIEHLKYHEKIFKNKNFNHTKKHLAGYASGFSGSKELRIKLMEAKSIDESMKILKNYEK